MQNRAALFFVVALLASCDDERCVDRDDDGYGEGSLCRGPDCDDSDPAIHEPMPVYVDGDGDGYAALEPVLMCPIPRGGGELLWPDCDDDDPNAYVVVEGYADEDGDGQTASETTSLCNDGRRPTWLLETPSLLLDCDDSRADVAVGAPEMPGDYVDQDCSGGDLDLVDDGAVLFVHAAFGSDESGRGYVNSPFASLRRALDCHEHLIAPEDPAYDRCQGAFSLIVLGGNGLDYEGAERPIDISIMSGRDWSDPTPEPDPDPKPGEEPPPEGIWFASKSRVVATAGAPLVVRAGSVLSLTRVDLVSGQQDDAIALSIGTGAFVTLSEVALWADGTSSARGIVTEDNFTSDPSDNGRVVVSYGEIYVTSVSGTATGLVLGGARVAVVEGIVSVSGVVSATGAIARGTQQAPVTMTGLSVLAGTGPFCGGLTVDGNADFPLRVHRGTVRTQPGCGESVGIAAPALASVEVDRTFLHLEGSTITGLSMAGGVVTSSIVRASGESGAAVEVAASATAPVGGVALLGDVLHAGAGVLAVSAAADLSMIDTAVVGFSDGEASLRLTGADRHLLAGNFFDAPACVAMFELEPSPLCASLLTLEACGDPRFCTSGDDIFFTNRTAPSAGFQTFEEGPWSYRLTSASPLVGAGVDPRDFVSIEVPTDFDGYARGEGGSYDIGAFEY